MRHARLGSNGGGGSSGSSGARGGALVSASGAATEHASLTRLREMVPAATRLWAPAVPLAGCAPLPFRAALKALAHAKEGQMIVFQERFAAAAAPASEETPSSPSTPPSLHPGRLSRSGITLREGGACV